MQRRHKSMLLTGLIALLILSACSSIGATRDWKVFAIEEEPAIDIQFRLPPDWYVDYAPTPNTPGQWDIALVPPKCSSGQETDFEDNCISLTAYIKGVSEFNKPEFLTFASQNITLNESESEETLMMGQNTFEVDGLSIQRFNHKVFIGEDEIQMSIFFFETDSAYYVFISEFPYDERDGQAAENFSLLIESIEVIE